MSSLPPPPWPPPPPPAPVDPPRHRPGRLVWIVVGLLVVVGLAASAIGVMLTRNDDDGAAAWDERVRSYAAFVEAQWGHEFRRAIDVEFLPDDEFVARLTKDTEEDAEELEEDAAILRSLGLIGPDVDLEAALDSQLSDSVVGFYVPERDELVVRGDDLTPFVEATLVHELTHALQDQYVDLHAATDDEDSGAATAFRALIEADADRIEQAWIDDLSNRERQQYFSERARFTEGQTERPVEVPAVLEALFAFPYIYGPPFLRHVLEARDLSDTLVLLEDPPVSEEMVLVPDAYLEGEEPVEVAAPAVPDDAEELDTGELGMFGWLVLLAARLGQEDATTAAEGWGGDAYVAYREGGGRVCTEVTAVGDTPRDTEELTAAVQAWVERGPEGAATVEPGDDQVTLRACDPGRDATVADDSALLGIVVRQAVVEQLLELGIPESEASCVVDDLLEQFSAEELTGDASDDERVRELQRATLEALTRCRAGGGGSSRG